MSRIEADKIVIGDSLVIKDSTLKQREKQVSDKVNSILSDAQIQAEKILADAKAEAENMKEIALEGMQEELSAIREQARKDGLEQGKQEIFEQFETQLSEKLEELTNFVDASFVAKNEIVKSAEKEIIDIIMMISRKIFTSELKTDDKYLISFVHSAVNSLKNKEQITLIVHPETAERLYNISDKLTKKIKELESINIITQSDLEPNSLIVESLKSRVYANLDEQLDRAEKSLYLEYKKNESENKSEIKQVEYKTVEEPEEVQEEENESTEQVEVVENEIAPIQVAGNVVENEEITEEQVDDDSASV